MGGWLQNHHGNWLTLGLSQAPTAGVGGPRSLLHPAAVRRHRGCERRGGGKAETEVDSAPLSNVCKLPHQHGNGPQPLSSLTPLPASCPDHFNSQLLTPRRGSFLPTSIEAATFRQTRHLAKTHSTVEYYSAKEGMKY